MDGAKYQALESNVHGVAEITKLARNAALVASSPIRVATHGEDGEHRERDSEVDPRVARGADEEITRFDERERDHRDHEHERRPPEQPLQPDDREDAPHRREDRLEPDQRKQETDHVARALEVAGVAERHGGKVHAREPLQRLAKIDHDLHRRAGGQPDQDVAGHPRVEHAALQQPRPAEQTIGPIPADRRFDREIHHEQQPAGEQRLADRREEPGHFEGSGCRRADR